VRRLAFRRSTIMLAPHRGLLGGDPRHLAQTGTTVSGRNRCPTP